MKLLALFWAFSSAAWAVCPSGIVASWDFNGQTAVEKCNGGYGWDFDSVGTQTYSNIYNCPVGGSYAPVTFSAVKYLRITSTASGFIPTSLALTQGIVQFSMYKNAREANQYPMGFEALTIGNWNILTGDAVSDNITWTTTQGGSNANTWTNTSGLQVCRTIALVFTTTSKNIYVSDNGGAFTRVTGAAANGVIPTGTDVFRFGSAFAAVSAELDSLIIGNNASASLPLSDVVSTGSTRPMRLSKQSKLGL